MTIQKKGVILILSTQAQEASAMIEAPRKEKFQVFWKDWKGEWVSNDKKYASKASAQRFANTIKKQAENGVYTVQVVL